MPRIQYRADTVRCGWGEKSAADRIFTGPSSRTMGAPAACDRTTIPARASRETAPIIIAAACIGRWLIGGTGRVRDAGVGSIPSSRSQRQIAAGPPISRITWQEP